MDLNQVEISVLIALRGNLSQSHISSKMGYSYNIYGRWERGSCQFKWKDFIKICAIRRKPIRRNMRNCYGIAVAPAQIDKIIESHLSRDNSLSNMAKKLTVSPKVLSRWLHGTSSPPFTKVLSFFLHYESGFIGLLDDILSSDDCSIEQEARKKNELDGLILKYPFIPAIHSLMELTEYQALKKYPQGFIKKTFGLADSEERYILSAMVSNNILKLENQKYIPEKLDQVRIANLKTLLTIAHYWSKKITKRIEDNLSQVVPQRDGGHSFKLATVSDHAEEEISMAWRECSKKISRILKNDTKKKTKPLVILFQCFDINNL